jgi:AbrB family looped-hinge helix DNA binding protein
MSFHRAKMTANGRIVIPAAFRKQLKLAAGEDLIVRVEDGEVRISSWKQALRRAQAFFSDDGGELLSEKLIVQRRNEVRRG